MATPIYGVRMEPECGLRSDYERVDEHAIIENNVGEKAS